MTEEWKKIPNWPDYSVSSRGRVRRDTPTTRNRNGGNILKPRAGTKGHQYVNLYQSGRPKSMYVHRLVLLAFCGLPPVGKPFTGHRDGDPSNNFLDNLRWVSAAENSADSVAHGTNGRPTTRGEKNWNAKLNAKKIERARHLLAVGCSARSVARDFGVSHSTILNAVNGRSYRECAPEQ